MERKERKGRRKAPRRFRMNEIRRRSLRAGVATNPFDEGTPMKRARKNTTAITRTKARNADLRIPSRTDRIPPGRNMQAEKPPSRTGLVHPEPQGGEDRRPHKPRRR